MCQREGISLQKGMNFRGRGAFSIFLMSRRDNAPYRDRIEENGTILIYEGHDTPKSKHISDPKLVDQPQYTPKGNFTENGKFHQAAFEYKKDKTSYILVRVYEKIRQGIWSYSGVFKLLDSWTENDGNRNVFKFKLLLTEIEDDYGADRSTKTAHSRMIPTHVKLEVWKRDGGKCAICGSKEKLHFDHIIPFSKGGTSEQAENIQLLCAKHNIQKSNNII